jgi:hypothetical protein
MNTEEPLFHLRESFCKLLKIRRDSKTMAEEIADLPDVCKGFGINTDSVIVDSTAKFVSDIIHDIAVSQRLFCSPLNPNS